MCTRKCHLPLLLRRQIVFRTNTMAKHRKHCGSALLRTIFIHTAEKQFFYPQRLY